MADGTVDTGWTGEPIPGWYYANGAPVCDGDMVGSSLHHHEARARLAQDGTPYVQARLPGVREALLRSIAKGEAMKLGGPLDGVG